MPEKGRPVFLAHDQAALDAAHARRPNGSPPMVVLAGLLFAALHYWPPPVVGALITTQRVLASGLP